MTSFSQAVPPIATQAEMEAGTETAKRTVSPLLVAQAIAALGGGGGNVVGPASATDGVPVLFDGTTGKLIKDSTPTGTGAVVRGTTPTIATPVINGLPTGTGVASAATASTLMSRDANANAAMNNMLLGYATTATAAGTTTLTVASANTQYFTGSTTQTVVMPVTSTLSLGFRFRITNLSTGNLTINSSGGNLIATIPPNMSLLVTCILTSGTTAASWNAGFEGFGSADAGRTFLGDIKTATAESAVTTLTLTPSATLTDGIYAIDIGILSAGPTSTLHSFYINADTTASNYRYGAVVSLGAAGGNAYYENGSAASYWATDDGAVLHIGGTLMVKNGLVTGRLISTTYRSDNTSRVVVQCFRHQSATTVTSIQMTASVASDINTGSFISLRRVG